MTILPVGYKAYVDTAPQAVVFGSGDGDESVLSSAGGGLSFFATGGSGTVVAGGGNNSIVIPSTDPGNWSINTGNGDDTVQAMGAGSDTINPGGGNNNILLGSGKTVMQSTGDDTVSASGGQATIAAIGKTSDLIFGGNQLFYVGTQGGSATVFGGTGSDTFFGGKGPDLVHGGTGGNNLLFAGTGSATLFGGGSGDQLYAAGSEGQALHAGAGNETLNGVFGMGADTLLRRFRCDADPRRDGQRHIRRRQRIGHGVGADRPECVPVQQRPGGRHRADPGLRQRPGHDRPARLRHEPGGGCTEEPAGGWRVDHHNAVGQHQDHLRRCHQPEGE